MICFQKLLMNFNKAVILLRKLQLLLVRVIAQHDLIGIALLFELLSDITVHHVVVGVARIELAQLHGIVVDILKMKRINAVAVVHGIGPDGKIGLGVEAVHQVVLAKQNGLPVAVVDLKP